MIGKNFYYKVGADIFSCTSGKNYNRRWSGGTQFFKKP